MLAFISDIHSNTEALAACLDVIDDLNVERILCLGDVIGYGPDPRETLLAVMERCPFSLLGNHEHGAMFYASDFNPRARAAIDWTRDQLNRRDVPNAREENMKMWNFLGAMKESHQEEDFLLVHGSPRDPIREYIVPRDAMDREKMDGCFDHSLMTNAQLCFIGHSHVPGVYPRGGGYIGAADLEDGYEVGNDPAIVNIGSVGQPRDGDNRSSFVTYDGERVRFHRVEYDFTKTMEKIRATPELPDYLADRLEQGR